VGITDEIAAFSPENIGVGIGGIRQRIKEVGGELRLKNAAPSGAILEAIIPISAASAHAAAGSRVTVASSRER
jgi:signal transduction histidine kinase